MRLMDQLYVKCVCPRCIKEFYPGDCDIVSTTTSGKVLKEAPKSGWRLHLSRLKPDPINREYVLELACRKCLHCGYNLPYNIELVENMNIVVVGDTFSGKSHYIAALIHQIQKGELQRADRFARTDCLTQDIEKEYKEEVLDPLFVEKRAPDSTIQATDENRLPLIYEIIISPSPEYPARRINLILYDASGEDLAIKERMVQFSRYVFNASAIIFLADPASMPEIFKQLPAFLQPQYATGRTSSGVLSSIIQLLERYHGQQAGAHLSSIPIAITLAKSDLLKQLATSTQQQYTFLKRPTYNGAIDLAEIETIDSEVRHLLADYGEITLLQATRNFSQVKFFATSATGYAPDKNGVYPNVEPCRCLDPVIWILHQLNILRTVV